MKISASVYAHAADEIDEIVHSLEQIGVDYFHIDCNNEPKVFDEIAEIKKVSKKPIDLHLITKTPEQYFSLIETHKPDFVSLQFEELPKAFAFPRIEGVKWGLAIKTETPISVFENFAGQCDFILIMATTPGKSGGQFDAKNFRKIRSFLRHFPNKSITVDGGVNAEVSFVLRSYGVQTAVVGSYLAKSDKQAVSLNQLKYENTDSHFTVEDMMTSRAHLPIIKTEDCSLENLLAKNEAYRLGYALIEDANENLVGISTNADIRRGLLKNVQEIGALKVDDIINTSPKSINLNTTIKDMLASIKGSGNFVSYIPVVDDKKLIGSINLHFLIKGEL
ncbi:MAG: CBS domain-containing protein [Bacteroidia bacterium]